VTASRLTPSRDGVTINSQTLPLVKKEAPFRNMLKSLKNKKHVILGLDGA
jgi:hypothetical protein